MDQQHWDLLTGVLTGKTPQGFIPAGHPSQDPAVIAQVREAARYTPAAIEERLTTRIAALAGEVATIKTTLAAVAAAGTDAGGPAVIAKMQELAIAQVARDEADRQRDEQHAAALADVEAEVHRRDARITQLQAALAQAGGALQTADDTTT